MFSMLIETIVKIIKQKPLGAFGGAIVLIMILVSIFANYIAPQGINEISLPHRLERPSNEFILGTDSLGRDVLSRVIYGARISIIIGLGAPAISVIVSLLIGGISGFIGGKYDLVVQRFVDAWMAFPPLIVVLTVMSLLGQGLFQVLIVLGISGGIGGSRTMRSAVIAIRENMYVKAADAIGATVARVLRKHILPNIMPVVIIIFTTRMASSILAEASISFLGFGVPPPLPSWGGMLSGEGRRYMLQAPGLAFWPGIALSVVVYGISMFGDAVRDILDPRMRGGGGRYTLSKKKEIEAKKRIKLYNWKQRKLAD